MAKKKGGRRAVKYDSSDDEVSSTTSTTASSDFGGQRETEMDYDESTELESFVDALYEKRASVREAGLRGLIGAFTAHVLTDFAERNFETLLQLFLGSIRRGGTAEVALGTRALGLLALTLGAGSSTEQILEEASPHLTRVLKTSTSAAARISAMESIAMLGFIAAADVVSTEDIMSGLWQVVVKLDGNSINQKEDAGQLRMAALASWTLLLSTIPTGQVAHYHGPSDMAVLSQLLWDDDVALRTVVGEALALLYEIGGEEMAAGDENEMDLPGGGQAVANGDTSQHTNGGGESLTDEVVHRLRGLALQPGRRQSKKERSQRSTIRDIMASLEDGIGPEASVKLKHGDVLCMNTWAQVVQLSALRRLLAEGFQRHMQENELLHQIFNYQPRTTRGHGFRSLVEKRMYQSPNSVTSKARTQDRRHSRSRAALGQLGHFSVTLDDE